MLDYLVAEAGVRLLHQRYSDAVWRHDYDAFAACFGEGGEWRISGMTLVGRPQIRETIERIMARLDRVLISFRNPILDMTDGAVSARTYIDERCAWTNGDTNIALGCYYERFTELGGRWFFKWRLFQPLYRGAPDMTGTFFEYPNYGAPPAMPPLDAVPPDLASARWGLRPDTSR
ncbi:MAG: nuclear transport factor 2 family protein [Novosphingobium sp.]